jgi:L-ribulose-5-phosphate 3-epimerase
VLDYAGAKGVAVGFEPAPGMFIDTMERYAALVERIDAPHFKLTLDVGHLHCLGEVPIAPHIRRWKERLVNVHIEDMKAGVHEHLMFGDGELDLAVALSALTEIGYGGMVAVELSRHAHAAHETVPRAIALLRGREREEVTTS